MIRRGIGVQPYTVGATPYIGLLDTYTGATAAYSVRKLRAAYTGSAIRVRRSSDNTEQDIGFDGNGNLDESALTTFVGANNGFVTTWYDQSGNSRNATQSTAVNQPEIVNSGNLYIVNNKPSIFFNIKRLEAVFNYTITAQTNFAVCLVNNTTGQFGRVLSQSANGNDYATNSYIPIIRLNGSSDLQSFINGGKAARPISYATQLLFTSLHTGTQLQNYLNGGIAATDNVNLNYSNTRLSIGLATSTTASGLAEALNGNIQEIIVYNTDQTTNRTGIRDNINTYFSIY